MDMYFCPLYSGSSGNALFCQYGETRLLIDAGKSGKTIEDALASIGADIRTISGVLITHEHSDHISGAGVLARKYHLPIYATRETWWAMKDKIGKIPPDTMREIEAGRDFWLGDIGVVPFSIPHDAADPVGFRLYGGSLSVSTAKRYMSACSSSSGRTGEPRSASVDGHSFACKSRMGLFCRMDAEMAALAPTQRAKWAIT